MTKELGPEIKASAPEFTLLDERKQRVTLSELVGEHGLLLTFIHGTWCHACVQALYRLRRYANAYTSEGIGVVVVAIDSPAALNIFKLSSEPPVTFPLLADEDEGVHQRYQLQRIGAYFIVDRDTVIQDKFLDVNHNGWPGHTKIMEAIHALKAHSIGST